MTTDSVFHSKLEKKCEKKGIVISFIEISLLEMLTFCAKTAFNEKLWHILKTIIHGSKNIVKIYIIR